MPSLLVREMKAEAQRVPLGTVVVAGVVLFAAIFALLSFWLPLPVRTRQARLPRTQPKNLAFLVLTAGGRAEQLDRLLSKLAASLATVDNDDNNSLAALNIDLYVANDAKALYSTKHVVAIAMKYGARLLHVQVVPAAKSVHLAHVFRWLLKQAFDELKYDYAVVLEDDLDVAPDIVPYFATMTNALAADPEALFCVSAWNDNGFFATSRDHTAIYRGEHFMGLGWMISQSVYSKLLKPAWPDDDFFKHNPHFPEFPQEWDDFFRLVFADEFDHGRRWECAYPEVPRTHHTFTTVTTASTYTTSLALQQTRFDSMRLGSSPSNTTIAGLTHAALHIVPLPDYTQWLSRAITDSIYLSSIEEARFYRHEALVVVCQTCQMAVHYHSMQDQEDGWHRLLIQNLGLIARGAEGVVRGIHQGVVILSWLTNRLIILAGDSPYAALTAPKKEAIQHHRTYLRSNEHETVAIPGQSCQEACASMSSRCDEQLMPLVNDCSRLLNSGFCLDRICTREEGGAWPAFISKTSKCYTAWTRSLSCAAAQTSAKRLCLCIK